MKTYRDSSTDTNLIDFPVSLGKLITDSMDEKDFAKKLKARKRLVGMGKAIVPHLKILLASRKVSMRKEAAKIIELIADKKSIPLLIDLLDDTQFDIRWIAAEGLIKIGRQSIIPLLKSVRDGKSSYFLNQGAHHVLNGLVNENEKEKLDSLMQSLDNFHELGETAPIEASKAIKAVFRYKR